MSFRPGYGQLPLALLLSCLLHVSCLVLPGLTDAKAPRRPPVLEAHLVRPALMEPAEDLLKNTLTKDESPKEVLENPARPQPEQGPGLRIRKAEKLEKQREQAAQRKLAKHLYYPEEAVRMGLEGDVRLLLKLDESGRVLSAELAASSGHAILDRAAMSAAYNMGSLPDAGVKEFILPVVFRLQ